MSDHPVTDYAIQVQDKRIIAGPLVRGACQRHLDDLERAHLRGLRFDEDRSDHALHFFPTVLRLNGGEFEGLPFELHVSQKFIVGSLFGWIREDGYRRFRVAYVEEAKGQGKAVHADTPIPTPGGLKPMLDIATGDAVLDENGQRCLVTAATEVMTDRPCYRITFSDGASIVADEQHIWKTLLRGERAMRLRTTKEIYDSHLPNHLVDWRRHIVACDKVESVPVKCISVDSPSSMYLAGETRIPTHNSPLLAGIGLYGIIGDREPRAEVYSAGSKKDQAMILFRDAVSMVRLSPALNARFKMSGRDDKVWNLFDPVTNSFFRPISAEQGQSGPRPHIGLIDELHEHKNATVVNMMSAGRKSRRQPLVIAITNSGFDKTSVCWEYHEKSAGVCLRGDIDDTFFSYVCALDDGEDPFLDERCWIKANPLLGVTITEEYLRAEVVAGRSMPSKESMVRRLNFCQWTQAESPLIPGDLWEAAGGGGEHNISTFSLESYRGEECIVGLDLSSVSDLTAAVFVIRKDKRYYWWPEFWIPADRVKKKVETDKVPYDIWIKQGLVRTTPGNSINLDHVANDIRKIINHHGLNIVEAAYDRWRIEDFNAAAARVGLDLPMVEFGQGYKDMGPAVDSLEKGLADGMIRHNKSPVLRWNAANAVVDEDPAGSRKFNKGKVKGRRIDGIVAACMAHHRMTLRPEAPPEFNVFWAE